MENALKFLFVCCCFGVSLYSYRFSYNRRDCLFLIAGMALTVASDFFLVYRDRDYTGLYIFSLVHAAYVLRVSENRKRSALLLAAAFACLLPAYLLTEPLYAAAVIYACFFIIDVAVNVRSYLYGRTRPKINRRLTLAGIVLFFICDINVLIFNLPRYFSAPDAISEAAYTALWIFYLSSQLILSVSAFDFSEIFPKFECELDKKK